MRKIFPLILILLTFTLVLSFSVSATSTCSGMTTEYYCDGSGEHISDEADEYDCLDVCETGDYTCCYWDGNSGECYGKDGYEEYSGVPSDYAGSCTLDGSANGVSCSVNGDCLSGNCRKEIRNYLNQYFCAGAGYECSDAGQIGYQSGVAEGNYLCISNDVSQTGNVKCEAGDSPYSTTRYWATTWKTGNYANDCIPQIDYIADLSVTTNSIYARIYISDLNEYTSFTGRWEQDGAYDYQTTYSSTGLYYHTYTSLDSATEYTIDFFDLVYETETKETHDATTDYVSPSIASTSVDDTGFFTANLSGVVNHNDYTTISVYFEIDDTPELPASNFTSGTGTESISLNLTGLNENTTYEYRLCVDYDTTHTVCTTDNTLYFTTELRTQPYINVATEYDIGHTNVSVGGTFFFEDFTNITAYVQIDGVNQTETDYTFAVSGVSQYHTETITGLDSYTNYTWDFCIYDVEFGEICEGDTLFTTLDYIPPSINVISAFDITNHEATLGGTILYNDYENMTLSWYVDDDLVYADDFTQVDEFDTSEYFTHNLTLLDYSTLYDYELLVTYADLDYSLQNVTTCDDPMTQLYDCDGTRVPLWDGSTVDATRCLEMVDNFEAYLSNPVAYAINFPDGLTPTCVEVDNGYCSVWDGTKVFTDDGSSFASNCTTSEVQTGEILFVNDTDNFTTLAPYIPYITISTVIDLESQIATLTGTHYSADYPSTVPFFRLDGVDLLPKTNVTKDYTTPNTLTYDLTGLTANTTYNYTFCVGYGLGWALIVCDTTKNFTTEFLPTVSFATPNPINKEDTTLHWTVDWNGATNVTYNFKSSIADVPAVDGVQKDYSWTGLDVETDYTYWLEIIYISNGDSFAFNTSDQYVTTAYENEFDSVWDSLLQGSSFAKILLGFVILFGIIFLGVGAFGKYGIQISMIAVLIFVIIGSILATLMHLFSATILILIIVGSLVLMALQRMFMSGGER